MSDVRIATLDDASLPDVAASRPAGAVRSGVVAGLAGGAAMAVLLAVFSVREELPALHAFRVIGDVVAGADAALGLAVHAATSAALGVLLAWIVPRDFPAASSAGVAAGYALFVMGFMVGVIVPWFHDGFVRDLHEIGGTWVGAHAVYGVVLGVGLARLRRSSVQKGPGKRRASTSQPRAS